MKILLSAFAFAPNVGSEGGVGWRWALELAKDHQVTVITDMSRQVLVKAPGVQLPDSLDVVFYRPRRLRSLTLNSRTAHLIYVLWQVGLLGLARRLHADQRFDCAVHLTYGVFRHPSFLGFLGIPFVFGPVGGGEDAPLILKRSIRGMEKAKELLRTVANRVALLDPFLWAAYAKASLILVKTDETRAALPWPFRQSAVVFPEIGIDPPTLARPTARPNGAPLKVLFVGRLLGWKGAHLAIRAVAQARRDGVPIEFTVVGRGPYEAELRRVAKAVGVHDTIRWLSFVPQPDLFALYQTMHCLLFPSLHDSSGNVVLEAQAYGLPVVCLDLGGPASIVSQNSAMLIKTQDASEEHVVHDLAQALGALWADETRRMAMSHAALDVARAMSWTSRAQGALELLEARGGSLAR